MPTLKVDLIIEDNTTGEFVLCLVENGPWSDLQLQLSNLQQRLYDSFDAIVDGHVAAKFPQSIGRRFRLQIDAYNEPPQPVCELVKKFDRHIQSAPELRSALVNSSYVKELRLVTRFDPGHCSV